MATIAVVSIEVKRVQLVKASVGSASIIYLEPSKHLNAGLCRTTMMLGRYSGGTANSKSRSEFGIWLKPALLRSVWCPRVTRGRSRVAVLKSLPSNFLP